MARKRTVSEEKSSVILDAALNLFAERGVHATNVPLIAERAGVAVGTLYHYFANKEAIANEVYRRCRREMAKAIYVDLPAGVPPAERFRVLWQRSVAYAMANPLAFRFLELHHHEGYLDEESHALDRQVAAGAQESLVQGRLAGILKPVNDQVLEAFIDGAIKSLVRSAQNGKLELTSEVVDQAAACCWQAIQEGWMKMEKFTLAGETGRISLSFEYPQAGAPAGEYRGTVAIASWGYQAQGKVWFTLADVAAFHKQLSACYEKLAGTASLAIHEESLKLEVLFERNGRVALQGTFRESHNEGNELTFRIPTDQSYVAQSLAEIAELLERHGG